MGDAINAAVNNIIKCRNYSRHGDLNEHIASRLGQPWRDYRKLWAEVNSLERELDYPLYVVMESFFACNLKCLMCAMKEGEFVRKYNHKARLAPADVDRVVDELRDMGTPSLALNAYNEPLMDKELLYYSLGKARQAGIPDVFFSTNATLLDEAAAERIIDLQPTQIRFSFDAVTKGTYEQIRIGAEFEKVLGNILRFMELKEKRGAFFPITRVSFVHMTINDPEMAEFIRFWMDKADYISIQRFMPYTPSEEQLALRVEEGPADVDFKCAYPFSTVYVRSNGDINCCCKLPYSTTIGNIHRGSIREAFNSEKMAFMRQCIKQGETRKIPACHRCLKAGNLL